MCVCAYMCAQACMFVSTHAHVSMLLYAYRHVSMFVCVCMFVCTHVGMLVCVCEYGQWYPGIGTKITTLRMLRCIELIKLQLFDHSEAKNLSVYANATILRTLRRKELRCICYNYHASNGKMHRTAINMLKLPFLES